MKYAIIGGGISGLSIANMISEKNGEVILFEKESRPGGLIKCENVDGALFHCTGGHVFNTKRIDVLDWFWKHFDKEKEFVKALRNSVVAMNEEKMIPYPIENHMFFFDKDIQTSFIADLLSIARRGDEFEARNFEEFLQGRFGKTLYQIYFQPYNYKVWRRDLTKVPLSWLAGKLPMPTVEEIIYNNMNHVEEREFVHSSFYYPCRGGSQFIADRLAKDLTIRYDSDIKEINRKGNHWLINGELANKVIFCGNIKQLPLLLKNAVDISSFEIAIEALESHGTTSVFCKIDNNDYSWIYLPDKKYDSHRIICTGNFSSFNNEADMLTATVEFTDYISKEEIMEQLRLLPYHPQYITHHFEQYTYPIQDEHTREMVAALKRQLQEVGIYLLGRFAEWEYYNMDVAMGAALDLCKKIQS